ncbi:C40 family peptidase [Demequina sp. NBRC 110056]|uniref:C40 family peptidase n=1 Tax=Demequina sp. NBRC 110056 TaxID=1570345 RepID=UPI000A01AD4A|nr:C40 family peptidase [Demequina sp. NBRC 110056]
MRARTRAVAATAGAALVVVPLTGAAAAALVSQDLTTDGTVNPDTLAIATVTDEVASVEASDAVAADLAAVTATVTADDEADFDVATPEINVKEDPPPAPAPAAAAQRSTTSNSNSGSSGSSGTKARPVAQSASVKAAISGSAIIAEAAKYVGTPYVSGGSSPRGFDCSGFVSYVYKQFGISLPRSSGAYWNVGTRVSSPQAGDIIVTPGHVGLYAGPNLQIDAPVPGKTLQFRAIWQSNPTYVRVTG